MTIDIAPCLRHKNAVYNALSEAKVVNILLLGNIRRCSYDTLDFETLKALVSLFLVCLFLSRQGLGRVFLRLPSLLPLLQSRSMIPSTNQHYHYSQRMSFVASPTEGGYHLCHWLITNMDSQKTW